MPDLSRRSLLGAGLIGASGVCISNRVFAGTNSLVDIGGKVFGSLEAKIYTAREIITLNPANRTAKAVAVVNGKILAVGALDQVKAILRDQPFTVDTTFADYVIVPGFVAQHDHPVLAALTMSSEILSIEDWALPSGTVPAVKDKQDFMTRLNRAVSNSSDPNEPVLSWGYHPSFFGPLTRADLDTISTSTPVLIWGRSCHEMFLNSAALERGGVTETVWSGFSPSEKVQSNLEEGHFWEQGLFAVLPYIASMAATPERLQAGLELCRDYMHSKGITIGNEPGGILSKAVQDGVNAVFSNPDMPFRWSFMVDAKSMVAKYSDDAQALKESGRLASWYGGMTSLAEKQAKLFADGAIYSQLMQVREPYLDNHHGAWMMDLDPFQRAFRVYWDDGYQIHIHVNGDAGLDRVLDTLEENLRRNPRYDHRTTIVHFAVSAPDQVERIKALGAIVSANPYYVTALADNYSRFGLGPERAEQMVRLGDVERAGISYSLHSDMPMAPADPLFLMWCAVNRITGSGRVAGESQRISREGALRGVTLDAAYSLQLDHEVGSISPGKRANLTVLGDNPLTIDPIKIKEIEVWGTLMEGKKLPVGYAKKKASLEPQDLNDYRQVQFAQAVLDHAIKVVHSHS